MIEYRRNMKSKKCALINKLAPNVSSYVEEYLIDKSNEAGQQDLLYGFRLNWQWQFRLDKIDKIGEHLSSNTVCNGIEYR